MKFRTMCFYIKEGFVNVFRNKIMSGASISIIASALIVFGLYIIMTVSIDVNSQNLMDKLEIKAYCDYELDEDQVIGIEEQLNADSRIRSVKMISKKEAFENTVKNIDEENLQIFEGLEYDFMPVAFIIKVKVSKETMALSDEIREIVGIKSVKFREDEVEFITTIVDIVRLLSMVLMVLLSIISTLIISNTVKLAMIARKREINIMKYIGATNWFVRWPFIIEGVVIGTVGAAVSWGTSYGFSYLLKSYLTSFNKNGKYDFTIVEFAQVSDQIIIWYLIIGVLIGVLGSVVSIRKYLKV